MCVTFISAPTVSRAFRQRIGDGLHRGILHPSTPPSPAWRNIVARTHHGGRISGRPSPSSGRQSRFFSSIIPFSLFRLNQKNRYILQGHFSGPMKSTFSFCWRRYFPAHSRIGACQYQARCQESQVGSQQGGDSHVRIRRCGSSPRADRPAPLTAKLVAAVKSLPVQRDRQSTHDRNGELQRKPRQKSLHQGRLSPNQEEYTPSSDT